MARQQSGKAEGSAGVPPPKVEDNTLDEQHAGLDQADFPVTDNDDGTVPSSDAGSKRSDRWRRIAVAAYLRAEKRGFTGGAELEDWLAAEREIDSTGEAH
jgi:hypothetical protein